MTSHLSACTDMRHGIHAHTSESSKSDALSYAVSHNSPRQCTIKVHPPQPLPHSLLLLLLSFPPSLLLSLLCSYLPVIPPLCLSPGSSVLLIPSEKKRQSRKSPLHLCHTLPRSLLSLALVSCWHSTTSSGLSVSLHSTLRHPSTSIPHFSSLPASLSLHTFSHAACLCSFLLSPSYSLDEK